MLMKSFAKINLGLAIKNKRTDGFHDLDMIMQSVSLFDLVKISKIDSKKILIYCDKNICKFEQNLAYRAAKIIFSLINLNFGIKIEIKKNIPVGAGLGGGSSNAAAVIFGLNKILNLNFQENKTIEICTKVGSDVPFCYYGGTMFCQGKGEILSKIDSFTGYKILLKFNNKKNYTKNIFEKFDNFMQNNFENNNSKIKILKEAILFKNTNKIQENCFNDFEKIIQVPNNWHLTGSGSAIFKIVNKNYINLDKNNIICEPVSHGVEIIENNWN
ncbi:MAG: 4-(cytidine 5'-diphospho)-2-C-methyl-D-erythritol kinase [Clostridia bacterium]|nr:4-(cytidine 5'-diphospho)-2-C-methyl-D-erythritol kinase [Clostridia bacterium]